VSANPSHIIGNELIVNLAARSHSLSVLSDTLFSPSSSPPSSQPLDFSQSLEYQFTLSLSGGRWPPVSVFSVGVGSSRTEWALLYIRCLYFTSVLDAGASLAEQLLNEGGLEEEQIGDVSGIPVPAQIGSVGCITRAPFGLSTGMANREVGIVMKITKSCPISSF
jgi:hypothetical protein